MLMKDATTDTFQRMGGILHSNVFNVFNVYLMVYGKILQWHPPHVLMGWTVVLALTHNRIFGKIDKKLFCI